VSAVTGLDSCGRRSSVSACGLRERSRRSPSPRNRIHRSSCGTFRASDGPLRAVAMLRGMPATTDAPPRATPSGRTRRTSRSWSPSSTRNAPRAQLRGCTNTSGPAAVLHPHHDRDNASTDATSALADRLAAELPGVWRPPLLARAAAGRWGGPGARATPPCSPTWTSTSPRTSTPCCRSSAARQRHTTSPIGTRLARGSRWCAGPNGRSSPAGYNPDPPRRARRTLQRRPVRLQAIRADRARDLLPLVETRGGSSTRTPRAAEPRRPSHPRGAGGLGGRPRQPGRHRRHRPRDLRGMRASAAPGHGPAARWGHRTAPPRSPPRAPRPGSSSSSCASARSVRSARACTPPLPAPAAGNGRAGRPTRSRCCSRPSPTRRRPALTFSACAAGRAGRHQVQGS